MQHFMLFILLTVVALVRVLVGRVLSSVTIFLPNHHLRYSTPALSLSAPLHSARVSGFLYFFYFATLLFGVFVFLSESAIFLADTFCIIASSNAKILWKDLR